MTGPQSRFREAPRRKGVTSRAPAKALDPFCFWTIWLLGRGARSQRCGSPTRTRAIDSAGAGGPEPHGHERRASPFRPQHGPFRRLPAARPRRSGSVRVLSFAFGGRRYNRASRASGGETAQKPNRRLRGRISNDTQSWWFGSVSCFIPLRLCSFCGCPGRARPARTASSAGAQCRQKKRYTRCRWPEP